MSLQYELRMEMLCIDRVKGSGTEGKPLAGAKNIVTIKTESFDMAMLPLLTKDPAHYHPVSACNENLNYFIQKAAIYKAGDQKPVASLISYDTVQRKGHLPTDPNAEIVYIIKAQLNDASERLKNIYSMYLAPEGKSGIPISRYSYAASAMRLADPVSFELASSMLTNTLKKGNYFDVFKWQELPRDPVTNDTGLFVETIARIEGLVPAFIELVSDRITSEGLIKLPSPNLITVHNFLERATDQSMIMTLQVQEHTNQAHGHRPGFYLLFPKASLAADLLKMTPALKTIIKDPYSFTPIAVSDNDTFQDLRALPEVMKLLKSDNPIVSKLSTSASKNSMNKQATTKNGLHY